MNISLIRYSLWIVLSFTFLCNLHAEVDSTAIDSLPSTVKESERTTSIDSTGEQNTIVYLFEIHDEIGPGTARTCEQAIAEAEAMNADYILLDLNTYGGYVDAADEMSSALLNTNIPTLIFIRDNAASAGAFISISCDSIYMSPTSTIGACAVVDGEGNIAPEKYQSYMRGEMRSAAEATNRDPLIAEGMVDPTIEIEGVTDNTEIITFTTKEAIKNGYCQGEARDIDEVLELVGIENAEIITHKVSITEKIIAFLVNPAVSGVLLMILVAGIYFELQSPGIGFPLAAAFICAMLYFAPHYLEGLAAHWEIALFILGMILLAVELFIIPGFGVAGILGIVFMVAGLVLSLVRNIDGFDFTFVPSAELGYAFLTVTVVMVAGLFIIIFGSAKLADSKAFAKFKLNESQNKEDGYVISAAVSEQKMVGRTGTVISDLRPSGKIEIDGIWHDAQSDGEYVEKGTSVKVERVHGAYLMVSQNFS